MNVRKLADIGIKSIFTYNILMKKVIVIKKIVLIFVQESVIINKTFLFFSKFF